jgi:transposase
MKIAPHLSLEEVTDNLHQADDTRQRGKWLVIYNALVDPRPADLIALHTATSRWFVHHTVSAYNRLGPASITEDGRGGRQRAYLTVDEERAFLEPVRAKAEAGELVTTRTIQQAFEERVGQEVHSGTIYGLLHRHGWHKIMPRPQHPQTDRQAQAAWLETFSDQVQAAVQDRAPDDHRPVVLLAEDEARFGRISTVQRCWAPADIRPTVPNQIVREWVYAFAAVDPASGRMTCLLLPAANTEMMNRFLAQVGDDFADCFVVMQVDGAPWHTSPKLQVPENIRLITQPAYSPELNPVEHLWDDIREKEFPNVRHDTMQQVKEAISNGVRRLAAAPRYLSSMTFFPHLRAAWQQLAWTLACAA